MGGRVESYYYLLVSTRGDTSGAKRKPTHGGRRKNVFTL
jgi:hypothetical protein